MSRSDRNAARTETPAVRSEATPSMPAHALHDLGRELTRIHLDERRSVTAEPTAAMNAAHEVITRCELADKQTTGAPPPDRADLHRIALGTGHTRALRELHTIERDFETLITSGTALVEKLTAVAETPLYRGPLAYLARTGIELSLSGEPLGLSARRTPLPGAVVDSHWEAEFDHTIEALERHTLLLARRGDRHDTLRTLALCHHALRDFHSACLAVERFSDRHEAEVRGPENRSFELDDLLKRLGHTEIRAVIPLLNRPHVIPNPALALVFAQRTPVLASGLLVAAQDSVPNILGRAREFLLSDRSPHVIRELKRLNDLSQGISSSSPVTPPASVLRPDPSAAERAAFVAKVEYLRGALSGDFERFVDTVGRKTGFRQANDRLKVLTRACRGATESIETLLGNDPTILTTSLRDFNAIAARLHQRTVTRPPPKESAPALSAPAALEAALEEKLCRLGIDGPLAIATVKWGFSRRGAVFYGKHHVSRERAIDFTAQKMPASRAEIGACLELLEKRQVITREPGKNGGLSLAPLRTIADPVLRELVGYALDFWAAQRKR
jgi:hypothetical protein